MVWLGKNSPLNSTVGLKDSELAITPSTLGLGFAAELLVELELEDSHLKAARPRIMASRTNKIRRVTFTWAVLKSANGLQR